MSTFDHLIFDVLIISNKTQIQKHKTCSKWNVIIKSKLIIQQIEMITIQNPDVKLNIE